MTVRVPALTESNLRVIIDIIRQMQRGRSNANGTFTLGTSVTSTSVTDNNCQSGSHVAITPQTANAAAHQRSNDVYVLPAAGSFTVVHASTAVTNCSFSYGIQG